MPPKHIVYVKYLIQYTPEGSRKVSNVSLSTSEGSRKVPNVSLSTPEGSRRVPYGSLFNCYMIDELFTLLVH